MKRGWLRDVTAAVASALSAVVLLHHELLRTGLSLLPGDVGDARYVQLVLEHGFRWVSGQTPSLWQLPIFHPASNTLAYSEVLLSVALPYWFARLLGAGPDLAMASWYLATTALNAFVFFGLARFGFRLSRVAAALGAVFFAAASMRASQVNHPQLEAMYFPAAALWLLLLAWRSEAPTRRRLCFAGAAAALVLQLHGGFYVGWFAGVLLAAGVAVLVAVRATRPRALAILRADGLVLLAIAVLAAGALVPLASRYLAVARELGTREWGSVLLARAQTWLNLGDLNWSWGWMNRLRLFQQLPVEGEQRFGLGLLTTAVLIAFVVRSWRVRAVRAVAIFTVAVLATATLWRFRVSPWWLVHALVPGGDAIRAVPRIGMFLLFPAALGLASGIDRRPPGWKGLAILAAVALCLVEQGSGMPTFDPRLPRADVESIKAALSPGCRAFYAHAPAGRTDYEFQLSAAWAALESGTPTVNGYSGNYPAGWELASFPADWEARLRRWLERTEVPREQLCVIALSG